MAEGKKQIMILLTFGTRPEFIKIKPLIDMFSKKGYPYKVLFTGQHTNLLPSGAGPLIDYKLEMKNGPNRLDTIVSSLMNQSYIWVEGFEYVLVQQVKVIDPLEYTDFIKELSQCRLLISDSGGIQEEASFFKKRVVVCRKKTERVEGLGTFFELCHHPRDLRGLFEHLLDQPAISPDTPSPFGDGTAALQIYNIVKEL
jgi:UDP-N-acetylglucosamine 2-epimerase